MKPVIVLVSQNECQFESLGRLLTARDFSWIPLVPGAQALAAISLHLPDLVIVDSGTDPDAQVLACVGRIKVRYPSMPVFLVAQKSSELLAIGALKAGVNDYFKPPFSAGDLFDGIDRIIPQPAIRAISSPGKDPISTKMVGKSLMMGELRGLLARVAMVDSTVLITGKTGTGKELAAGLIHANSNRSGQPMVSINCAALPDSLVESELFGYVRGAFTGAVATTRGRFEQAQGGTVFLDEIGDMTPFAQAKILRVIEDKHISPLGGATSIPLDFRLIAATSREPETLMEEGTFRDDLFYRLNVARVNMPSLGEHREDIPLLTDHCIRLLNLKFNRNIQGLESDALNLFYRYDWPGNVRELMNVLESAFINLPEGRIGKADLPACFKKKLWECRHLPTDERKRILTALIETNWNKSTAARKLNWSRMTLYRKMARHDIVEKRSPRKMAAE